MFGNCVDRRQSSLVEVDANVLKMGSNLLYYFEMRARLCELVYAERLVDLEIVQQVTSNLQAIGINFDQAALTAINTIAKHDDTRTINSETEFNPNRPVPWAEDDSTDVR